jgi:hypothetical protein
MDMEQLPDEDLMLITIELIMNKFAKLVPSEILSSMLYGLQPPSSRAIKIHGRNFDPTSLIYATHVKVVLTSRLPQFYVLSVKLGKRNFGPMTRVMMSSRTTRTRIAIEPGGAESSPDTN